MQGKVKWFSKQKGYGFIFCEDDNKDYFVHCKSIVSDFEFKFLCENQTVSFDVEESPRGLQAKNVVLIKKGDC